MKIRRVLKYYFLVVLMGLVSMAVTASGFVLWLALPHGGGGGGRGRLLVERDFWSISRDVWVNIHDWGAVVLIAIAVGHIVLHWRWLVNMTAQVSRSLRLKSRVAVPVRVEE